MCKCLHSQQQVAVVYIDFSKAFIVVSHKNIILKALHRWHSWLQNFLTGRTHRTKLGRHVSDIAQLISGVVQAYKVVAYDHLCF